MKNSDAYRERASFCYHIAGALGAIAGVLGIILLVI